MRNFFLAVLLCFCIKSKGQLIADPALSQVSFTDLAGNAIDDTMPLGYIAQLNIPIKNLDAGNGLPAGTCKIKIGLGTKLILAPMFDLTTVNSSEYFQWTAAFVGGQVQLTGELVAPLPANYAEVAKFNVQGSVLEYSTITTNFLVTNHNTQVILSDEDPANNTSFRQYKIVSQDPIPVNISNLSAVNNNCSLLISFTAENEINVDRYEIETSKDGLSYTAAATIIATNNLRYTNQLDITSLLTSTTLYIRIRSIDRNGSFRYSNTKTTNSICNSGNTAYLVYPNPVVNETYITVKKSTGIFNGYYRIELFDSKGSLVKNTRHYFNNQSQYEYPVNNLSSGQYILKMINNEASPVILKIQKQ